MIYGDDSFVTLKNEFLRTYFAVGSGFMTRQEYKIVLQKILLVLLEAFEDIEPYYTDFKKEAQMILVKAKSSERFRISMENDYKNSLRSQGDNMPALKNPYAELISQVKRSLSAELEVGLARLAHVDPAPQQLLTTKELSQYLQISESTISAQRKAGRIPFLSFGSSVRYNLNSVIIALEKSSG